MRTQVQRIIRIKCKLNFVFALAVLLSMRVVVCLSVLYEDKISKAPPINFVCDFLAHKLQSHFSTIAPYSDHFIVSNNITRNTSSSSYTLDSKFLENLICSHVTTTLKESHTRVSFLVIRIHQDRRFFYSMQEEKLYFLSFLIFYCCFFRKKFGISCAGVY